MYTYIYVKIYTYIYMCVCMHMFTYILIGRCTDIPVHQEVQGDCLYGNNVKTVFK